MLALVTGGLASCVSAINPPQTTVQGVVNYDTAITEQLSRIRLP
jgi:hypothetical protein